MLTFALASKYIYFCIDLIFCLGLKDHWSGLDLEDQWPDLDLEHVVFEPIPVL